ncbi:filamentous hemagglutinin N-terminal domain-containing protein, partial [Povalibacter sp.]|uniref:two-partner secretion domain-containing protein n=1 Tax=Povalibacter sp. TaxID=1962978 RepID=UPI002F40B72D
MNTNDISRSRYLAAAVSAALTFAAAAHAGPQNGVVTNGAATISTPAANLTQIDQTTNSVSIDWQSFDVGANEGVHFNQPSASSVALNRILTQDPSQILGNISANGRVFLLNPNGIIFGSSARVNVGSLVASSLDLTDADAAAGRYSLATAAERSGAIVNDGVITAVSGGSITLLGGSVLNNGLILADYGTVNLGAGRAATLSFDSDGLMRFQIDAGLLTDTNGVSAAVHNSGEISAAGGQVLLTAQQAGDVVAQAVNNEGVIRASRIENVGGVIRLVGSGGTVANSGTLEATGTSTGGTVHVLGERVEIAGTTAIDVSGANGGGTALIGGSYRGADATVLNAQQTSVAAGAIIRADSTTSGDAGQVVLWSDGTTRFHGDISARALGSSGNGGNVEVSGGEHLGIRGHAWLDSANGNSGHLLLDPGALTIVAGDAATTPDYDTDLDTLTDGWVNEQLTSGNLDIVTSASVTPGVTEDLTVAAGADINWTDAGITLRIEGGDSIAINGTINGAGALTLESGGMIALGGNISVGTLDVTAGANITQSSAVAVTGTASFTTAGGSSILLGTTGNAFDGDVTFAASSGTLQNVTLVNSTAIDLQALSIAGNLNVTAGSGSITQSGALSVGGDATFTADAGQSVTLGAANTFTGAVAFVGDGGTLSNVTVRDMSALTLQAMSIDGDLSATAAGLTAQALTVGGDLSLTSSGGISQTGALNVTGNSTFTAGVGQSIALGEANTFNGTVGFVGSGGNLGNVTISDSNELTLQALNITGNLTATAA